MPSSLAHRPRPAIDVRRAEAADLEALIALERQVFATDQLSRRSMRRLLDAPTARIIVAEQGQSLVGAAVVLYRAGSEMARLYSIAVAPAVSGRGIGAALLDAAETHARTRGCRSMRLEVHESNAIAIARYRKSGYREFGRHASYYDDGGDALRFQKPLAAKSPRGWSRA